jgi:hypothetical protein
VTANDPHHLTKSRRRVRRVGGTSFAAITMVLVPAQCQPTTPAAVTTTTVTTTTTTAPTPPPAAAPAAIDDAAPAVVPVGNLVPAAAAATASNSTSKPAKPSTPTKPTPPTAATCAGPALTPGTNLLVNPSFEGDSPLAPGWFDESTTAGPPIYSVATRAGVVDGSRGQAFTYVGLPDDDGSQKAQFYQAPVRGAGPGTTVRFSICVAAAGTGPASLVRSYATVGVEAFRADGSYLSDAAVDITRVDATPTRYVVDYTIPDGADYLAVFVQSPEVYATSVFDLVFDHAQLVAL